MDLLYYKYNGQNICYFQVLIHILAYYLYGKSNHHFFRKRGRMKNKNGFTLLELITVIAIIGILSAIAIPSFSAWNKHARLRSATQDLMADLSMARMRAIQSGENVNVSFSLTGYVVFIDENDNGTWQPSDDTPLRNKDYPQSVTMTGTTFAGSNIVFEPTGNVQDDDGILNSNESVTLGRGDGDTMTVKINGVGSITSG